MRRDRSTAPGARAIGDAARRCRPCDPYRSRRSNRAARGGIHGYERRRRLAAPLRLQAARTRAGAQRGEDGHGGQNSVHWRISRKSRSAYPRQSAKRYRPGLSCLNVLPKLCGPSADIHPACARPRDHPAPLPLPDQPPPPRIREPAGPALFTDGPAPLRVPERGARLEAQCDELKEEGPTFETINSRCPAFLAHRGQAYPRAPLMMNGSPRAIWTRNCWMVHAAVGCSVTFSAGIDTCPTLRTTKTAGIRRPTTSSSSRIQRRRPRLHRILRMRSRCSTAGTAWLRRGCHRQDYRPIVRGAPPSGQYASPRRLEHPTSPTANQPRRG